MIPENEIIKNAANTEVKTSKATTIIIFLFFVFTSKYDHSRINFMKTAILILAAGKGTRMGTEDPKVIVNLNTKPLIKYLLESLDSLYDPSNIYIIVGYKKKLVQNALTDKYNFIEQTEQLGTGHAVMCAKESLNNKFENILVLYGDMPFVSIQTINSIINKHSEEKADLTMATISVDNFNSWQSCFYDFGRIVRNDNNRPIKIVEKKDATPEELAIKEVNPSYFCFNSKWLWKNIDKIKANNAQKEYYLTDLLALAIKSNSKIETISINPKEGIGINTQEQLEFAGSMIDGKF